MFQLLLSRPDTIQYSLWMMGQGMLGIFVFTGIFYLLIYGLEKIFNPKFVFTGIFYLLIYGLEKIFNPKREK